MKQSKFLILVLALVLAVIPVSTFAHGMLMNFDGNTITVEYDGNPPTPAENAEVILLDASGAEIGKGTTDANGKYQFDSSLAVAKATASDGMGHKSSAEPGVEEVSIPKLPIVIGVFVVIGAIFLISSKRKKKAE